MDNMKKPLVSVIMGTYNCEGTIRKSIESILKQSYTNWEFIICDDASTDRTYKICREYEDRDGRIRIIKNKQNRKLAAALNRCLEIAKGTYIARMDADDISLPGRLEKEVDFLESHADIDVVGCCCYIFNGKSVIARRMYQEYPKKQDLLLRPPYLHPAICMRRQVYEKLHGYVSDKRTVRAEDLDLWFRFYEKGYTGYNMQEYLYIYRETIGDYKKRTLKAGIETAKVFLNGYRRLHFPWYLYPFAFKPVVSALLPDKFMHYFHNSGKRRQYLFEGSLF